MKIKILFLSSLLAASVGFSSISPDELEKEPTWRRVAQLQRQADLEKCEILKSAKDHRIVLPSINQSQEIMRKLMGVSFPKTAHHMNSLIGSAPVTPEQLGVAIEFDMRNNFRNSSKKDDPLFINSQMSKPENQDKKCALLLAFHVASEKRRQDWYR